MKYYHIFLIITTFIILGCEDRGEPVSERSSDKPNIIIIYTDDQGTIDANSFGATDLFTPNIDKLAETGVKFTQFYTAASVCSPSRASLLTGLTPLLAGLPGNTSSQPGNPGMPTEQVTIAEKLRDNGYKTGHIGKWHLGYTPETMPNGQGFDYSFGHMGGCIDNYSHFFYWSGPNRHDLWENGNEIWRDGDFFQDLMVEKSEEFIRVNRDSAFFMYYAINLPHYPLQGTDKWREYYKELESPRDMYAATISTIDERIGKLIDLLEELNLRENTIVIFQSDHGHSMETRTFNGGGSAGIYRGSKFSNFEGGIRVPAIISWPGSIPQNEERKQMSINIDWFPTLLEMAGVPYSKDEFEGMSLKGVIESNQESPHESFWWYKNPTKYAVRKGSWKLLKNPHDPTNRAPLNPEDSVFLVNLENDPEELNNLAVDEPQKVAELEEEYKSWYKGVLEKIN